VLDDVAVDRIHEDEAAPLRRILHRVAQHPPRRPAAKTAPDLLRRRVADGEADVMDTTATTPSRAAAHSQPSLTIGEESRQTSHTPTQRATMTR
jgi:hypothetical protein